MQAVTNKPKLRDHLDIRLEKVQGQHVLVMNCLLGMIEKPLVLYPQFTPVVLAFDGNHTTSDILNQYSEQGLTEETLHEFITLLDKNYLLDSPIYQFALQQLKESFSTWSVRPPALINSGYPGKREELSELIEYLLSNQLEE